MSKQNIDEMSNDELDDIALTLDKDRELEVAPPGEPRRKSQKSKRKFRHCLALCPFCTHLSL